MHVVLFKCFLTIWKFGLCLYTKNSDSIIREVGWGDFDCVFFAKKIGLSPGAPAKVR
jgi:hypothetical protein